MGSGQGHFLPFLRSERNFSGQYIGIELLPFFHQTALELYGHQRKTNFICAEFLSHDFGDLKFDWVLSLGGLSVKQNQQQAYDLAFCNKMVSLTRHGISIYLNDKQHVPADRLKQVPDLAVHDIPEFVSMLQEQYPQSKTKVIHYPTPTAQKTIIHLKL